MTTRTIERKNYYTVLAVIIASLIALLMIFNVQSASAQSDSFNLTVKHGINGKSLGLEKDLPVDVYVNGEKAFTFSFKDVINTSLPAGEYNIMVKLANTDVVVMSLGPVNIPGDVDVSIRAKLSAEKTPTLKVQVK